MVFGLDDEAVAYSAGTMFTAPKPSELETHGMERIDKQNKSLRVPLFKQPFLGWTCSLIKPVLWRLVVRYQLRYCCLMLPEPKKNRWWACHTSGWYCFNADGRVHMVVANPLWQKNDPIFSRSGGGRVDFLMVSHHQEVHFLWAMKDQFTSFVDPCHWSFSKGRLKHRHFIAS